MLKLFEIGRSHMALLMQLKKAAALRRKQEGCVLIATLMLLPGMVPGWLAAPPLLQMARRHGIRNDTLPAHLPAACGMQSNRDFKTSL